MFSEQAWAEIGRSLKLSARELQIVRAVFDDRTESAIAADLGISPHTVHSHFERLHYKLAVADRVELIVRVMDEFLALTAAPESTLPSICANRTAGRCPLCAPVKFGFRVSDFALRLLPYCTPCPLNSRRLNSRLASESRCEVEATQS
jgi:DNA-binding CsgD family transcriptional regulator